MLRATVLFFLTGATITMGQSYGPNEEGWVLVARQRTPAHVGGGYFPRDVPGGAHRLNPDNPNAALYSILDSLETFRQADGDLIFKLSYPGMCESSDSNPNNLAACVDGKEYNIWRQTTNPYSRFTLGNTTSAVDGYTPIDVPYPRGFGGLGASVASNSLMDGNPGFRSWWYAVGTTGGFGGDFIPAALSSIANLVSTQMELFVWGPTDPHPPVSNEWVPVYRHVASSGLWAPGALTVNNGSQSPRTEGRYARLADLETYRNTDNEIVFKMVFPGLCTYDFRGGDCFQGGRNYLTWAQQSNPTAVGQVVRYTEMDAGPYRLAFGGLRAASPLIDVPGPLLVTGTPTDGANAAFSLGQTADYGADCGSCLPGPISPGGGFQAAPIVELYVWGPHERASCPVGQFNLHEIDANRFTCTALTRCVVGQTFETTAATAYSNRACSAVASCMPEEYEVTAPTRIDDRECRGITRCLPFEFEFRAPTRTSDRRCVEASICAAPYEEEVRAATATTDRVCLPTATWCPEGQYVGPTGLCQTATPSCPPGQFWSRAGPHNNAVCTPVTTCGASEFAAVAATPTSDAVCVASSICNPAIETEATGSNGPVCDDKCSPCPDGAAVQVACDAENARVCAQPAPASGSGVAPSIQADGRDLTATPGAGGKFKVDGPFEMQGIDVGAWIKGLQDELQTLRAAVLQKDRATQQQLAAAQVEIKQLRSRLGGP